MNKYFVSYIALNEFNNSEVGNCCSLRENKIKTIEDIRDIEKMLCEEFNFKKVNITNFIKLK